MPVDCQVAVSNPPAAVTRTPFTSIPSFAASRYTSLSTHPAAARCSKCPPVKSASTVTPSGVHRCGKRAAPPESDLSVPAPTATSKRLSMSPFILPLPRGSLNLTLTSDQSTAACLHWHRTAAREGPVGLDQDTLAGHEDRGHFHILRQGDLPGRAAVVEPVRGQRDWLAGGCVALH